MKFAYAFGRPVGRVGYRTRIVHLSSHAGESADWSYQDIRDMVNHPEMFRSCGTCRPNMESVIRDARVVAARLGLGA